MEAEAKEQKGGELSAIIEVKGDKSLWAENLWVDIVGGDTCADVKAKIQDKTGKPIDEQRLISPGGEKLEDDTLVSDVITASGEKETSRVHFILEFGGGGTSGVFYGGIF